MDFGQFLSYIASGTFYTVGVTLIALPSGLLFGTILALLYVYGGKTISRVMNLYSTIFRGIPPIVLLFILFFAVSKGINLSAFWAGSLSLGMVSSAYQMEIVRGALLSVSGDQLMAARAVGLEPAASYPLRGLAASGSTGDSTLVQRSCHRDQRLVAGVCPGCP